MAEERQKPVMGKNYSVLPVPVVLLALPSNGKHSDQCQMSMRVSKSL